MKISSLVGLVKSSASSTNNDWLAYSRMAGAYGVGVGSYMDHCLLVEHRRQWQRLGDGDAFGCLTLSGAWGSISWCLEEFGKVKWGS